ncbi:imidazolonepropionase-like domain-containing protein [Streptomyces sp. NPDC002640]
MPTIHAAELLVTGDRRPPVPRGAVLVEGRTVVSVGPYEEVVAAHPAARVRRWPGIITPGLVNPHGPELLEGTYHPDPREADELGTEPLAGERLTALEMTDARWSASARRGVQRMLAHGTVAVAGALRRPGALDAVDRVGLVPVSGSEERFAVPGGPPSLDPLAGRTPAEAYGPPFALDGADATFAVFDVPDEAALAERGASTCVATVLHGRLLFRRR